MTKYQNAVMWLGLALIAIRYLTTGQRSAFHKLLTSGGSQNLTPNSANQNQGKQPQPTPNPSPTPPKNTIALPIGPIVKV